MTTATREIVLLRGGTLLDADTLLEIATLGEDGTWRTPDGAITDSIGVPEQAARAIVKPAEQRAAHKAQDAAWVNDALGTVRAIAASQQQLTVDDVHINLGMPPRRPSVMSTLMVAAGREGLIEQTSRHQPSIRPINGGRRALVWRSLIYHAGAASGTAVPTGGGR